LLIFCFSLTIISCGEKDEYESWGKKGNTPLSSPSDLTATSSAGRVALDWSAVNSASSYTVYWDNSTGVSSSSTAITSVSTDNYTHSSLDNGSTYYYKVAAVDTDNTTGSLSSEVSAATPLPAPDNLSVSGANNTIILTWNSVSGATSYTAQEKVIILRKHLLEKIPISDICERYELRPTVFYRWQKQFFEQGARTFEVEKIQDRSKAKKILALEQKLQIKNEVLSELMEEHIRLKKNFGEV